MKAPVLLALAALAIALPAPVLAALQVSVEPERIAPVALGDARIWNAYVTVTVVRDGRSLEGASVELRGPSGTLASGRTDGAGRVVLPVLSREPASFEAWVDGAPSGRQVQLAGAAGSDPSIPPATAPQPPGPPGWAFGAAAIGIGALFLVFMVFRLRRNRPRAFRAPSKKRFKRGD